MPSCETYDESDELWRFENIWEVSTDKSGTLSGASFVQKFSDRGAPVILAVSRQFFFCCFNVPWKSDCSFCYKQSAFLWCKSRDRFKPIEAKQIRAFDACRKSFPIKVINMPLMLIECKNFAQPVWFYTTLTPWESTWWIMGSLNQQDSLSVQVITQNQWVHRRVAEAQENWREKQASSKRCHTVLIGGFQWIAWKTRHALTRRL